MLQFPFIILVDLGLSSNGRTTTIAPSTVWSDTMIVKCWQASIGADVVGMNPSTTHYSIHFAFENYLVLAGESVVVSA